MTELSKNEAPVATPLVICPNCVHQFVAVSERTQDELSTLSARLADAKEHARSLDAILDEEGVAVSCINRAEDLRRAFRSTKARLAEVERERDEAKRNRFTRDWPEDETHENGCYTNQCISCGRRFIGHKRRVVCKICTAAVDELRKLDARAESAEARVASLSSALRDAELDAKRYRWLRCGNALPRDAYAWFVENKETAANAPDNIDAAIDAALAALPNDEGGV